VSKRNKCVSNKKLLELRRLNRRESPLSSNSCNKRTLLPWTWKRSPSFADARSSRKKLLELLVKPRKKQLSPSRRIHPRRKMTRMLLTTISRAITPSEIKLLRTNNL
jgi:hypothetical protein